MKHRFGGLLAVSLALAVVTNVAGCSKNGAEASDGRHNHFTQPHILRIVDSQDFPTLNPHLYAAASLSMISELTMAYLVRYDHRERPYPELLTDIPTQDNGGISRDGRRITFHLRRGVRWSDGWPFSAADVVFSINAVKNPANNEVSRDGWDLIDRVDQHGDDTVVLHLRQPYAIFLPTFFGTAGANPCILPEHLLGHLPNINSAPYNGLPVGIGPFRYIKWQRAEAVTLEANPYYFRGMPRLKRIEFKTIPNETTALTQMETGEADLWPLVRSGLYAKAKTIRTAVTQIIPGTYFSHLDFNLSRPEFADWRVREAIRLGTDREQIRHRVRHDTGSLQEGYGAPGSVAYDVGIPFHAYNVTAANRLLDEAGWVRGPDGIRARNGRRMVVTFVVATGNPDTDTLVEVLRQMWHALGIDIVIRSYDTTLLFDRLDRGGILASGKFDVTEFAWQGDVMGDLSDLYTCRALVPQGQNYLHYCNPRVDRLYRQMKQEYDAARRKPLLSQIQRLIVNDVPTMILSMNDDIYTMNSDVHNFHPNAVSPLDDMMDVDI